MRKGILVVFFILIVVLAFVYPHYMSANTDSLSFSFAVPLTENYFTK